MNYTQSLILFVLVTLLASANLLAQQPPADWPGFAVGPAHEELVGNAGQTLNSAITVVTRNTKKPTKFDIEVMDLGQRDAYSTLALPKGDGARSCADWLTVQNTIQVPPNARMTLPYTLRLPPAAQGEYYGFLVIRLAEEEVAKSRIALRAIPAVQVRLEVRVRNRPARLSTEIPGLRIEPAQGTQPARAIVQVSNKGNVKTPLEGDILFRSPTGGFPIRMALPQRESGRPLEIYPGATVELSCVLPTPLAPGHYSAQVRAVLLGNRRMQSEFEVEVPGEKGAAALGKFLGEAAFKVDMTVEPSLVDLTLPRGARRTVAIRVRNNGDKPVEVTAQPALVRIEPDGLFTYASDFGTRAEEWVQLTGDRFTLGPRRTTVVQAQVIVPQERLGSNTVARAVLIKGRMTGEGGDDKTASVGEYPVLILARDPKASPARLESTGIELVRVSPKANPATAVVRVKNSGGQIGEISGRIWLQNAQGGRLATLSVGEQQKEPILPEGMREFRLALPPLDKGEYTVFAKLNAGGHGEGVLEAKEGFSITTAVPEGLKGTETTASPAGVQKPPAPKPKPKPAKKTPGRR